MVKKANVTQGAAKTAGTKKVKANTGNTKQQQNKPKKSNRLNFSMIYYVLSRKEVQSQKLSINDMEKILVEDYGVKLGHGTINRILGDVAYQLLNVKSRTREKKLFPFRLHCQIPFSVKFPPKALTDSFYEVKKTSRLWDDSLTIQRMQRYFPIKTDKKNQMSVEIILPLSDVLENEDGEAESDYNDIISLFMKKYSDSVKSSKTNQQGTYYLGNGVRYSIEEERLPALEQKILMDMIDGYAYITREDTAHFLKKLDDLSEGISLNRYINNSNQYQYLEDIGTQYPEEKVEKVAGKSGKGFFENFEVVMKCILEGHKMRIRYGKYDVDEENKRPKLAIMEKYIQEGRVVSPYHSMWANGYYYIIVTYDSHKHDSIQNRTFSALRMDRILRAEEELDEKGKPIPIDTLDLPQGYDLKNGNKFSTRKIAKSAVVMQTDKPEPVKFRCKKALLNNVVDGFGFDVKVEKTKAPKDDKDEWIEVQTTASIFGTALWLTQHCAASYAIFPDKLVKRVKDNLSTGAGYYQ